MLQNRKCLKDEHLKDNKSQDKSLDDEVKFILFTEYPLYLLYEL